MKNRRSPARKEDQEVSPGPPSAVRPAPWADVPDAKWNDWRWQMSQRLRTSEDLRRVLRLTADEQQDLVAEHHLRCDLTPYFASLLDPEDANCPLRRQVVPTGREAERFDDTTADSLAEEEQSPVPGLVHRYPDRVLMLVTTQCASYCRYCTRSRIVGDGAAQFGPRHYEAQIEYVARTPSVRDVLVSGGDPLVLAQGALEGILRRLREIPHVEVIRIGTRVPVFLPQRIDDNLVEMLSRYHPLWMNVHFNHPREITPEARRACALLAGAGIPLGSQTVLLAGINDCPNVMRELVHELVKLRVRPYYLYQCDEVEGAAHFRTPIGKGVEIIESLRGHTSGFAVPTFVVDGPGGGGKIPVQPHYDISHSDRKVVLRNYEGFVTTYAEPGGYVPHDPRSCSACRRHRPGREDGVAGLLAGDRTTLAPEGYRRTHQRLTNARLGSLLLVKPEPEPEDGG